MLCLLYGLLLIGTCCTLDKQSCAMYHQLAAMGLLMGLPIVCNISFCSLFNLVHYRLLAAGLHPFAVLHIMQSSSVVMAKC